MMILANMYAEKETFLRDAGDGKNNIAAVPRRRAESDESLEAKLKKDCGMTLAERNDMVRRIVQWFDYCQIRLKVVDKDRDWAEWKFKRTLLFSKSLSCMRDLVWKKTKVGMFSNRGILKHRGSQYMKDGNNGACIYVQGHYLPGVLRWDEINWWAREDENDGPVKTAMDDRENYNNALVDDDWNMWAEEARKPNWMISRTTADEIYSTKQAKIRECKRVASGRTPTPGKKKRVRKVRVGDKKKAASTTPKESDDGARKRGKAIATSSAEAKRFVAAKKELSTDFLLSEDVKRALESLREEMGGMLKDREFEGTFTSLGVTNEEYLDAMNDEYFCLACIFCYKQESLDEVLCAEGSGELVEELETMVTMMLENAKK